MDVDLKQLKFNKKDISELQIMSKPKIYHSLATGLSDKIATPDSFSMFEAYNDFLMGDKDPYEDSVETSKLAVPDLLIQVPE